MRLPTLLFTIGLALATTTSCQTTGTTSTKPGRTASGAITPSGEANTAPTEGTPMSRLQRCLARAESSADPMLERDRCRRSLNRSRGGGGG